MVVAVKSQDYLVYVEINRSAVIRGWLPVRTGCREDAKHAALADVLRAPSAALRRLQQVEGPELLAQGSARALIVKECDESLPR